MKIITFLGPHEYEEVTYEWPGKKYVPRRTKLFPEALAVWLKEFDQMIVLLTPDAEAGPPWLYLKDLPWASDAKGQPRLVSKPIPPGKDDEQLWRIFGVLRDCLDTGDEVVLDITHAFRSIPVLALLAIAFLRTAHSVSLKHLLYGAYDARDKKKIATVFDLTPFVSLLDWVTATDQFIKTGSAQALSALLEGNPPKVQLGDNIFDIAQGLRLLRPSAVMAASADLSACIDAAKAAVPPLAPPFASLLQRVEDEYGRFALADPFDYHKNAKAYLLKQLDMAEWYRDKRQYVHAIALAREWVPSLLCFHCQCNPFDDSERRAVELLLHTKQRHLSKFAKHWTTIPVADDIYSLWHGKKGRPRLVGLRNDVLHAGFQSNAQKPADIIQRLNNVLAELRTIAAEWNLDK